MATLKDKNVMVTGGAGFIGSHLCDAIIKEPVTSLISVDNLFLGKESNLDEAKKFDNFIFERFDITNFNETQNLIDKYDIDVIFHLAVIPLEVSIKRPVWCFDQNVHMTQSILESIRNLNKSISLVAYSSSEAYGSAVYTPMDENHPLLPHTPYAASKAASDLIAYSYYKTFNLDVTIIRPFNNYGPRQNEGSYAGVIPLTIKRILNGEKPIIYGDGKQTRDFIYVTDTAKATIDVYKNEELRGEIINLASGEQIKIEKIIKTICDEFGYTGNIEYRERRPGDVRVHEGSTEKARRLVDFKPSINFTKGIKLTIDWYKKNKS
jgi:UDP-glucose 4-epimerase